MTTNPATSSVEKLQHNLLREVYQTETSAVRHCQREADRLGAVSPAQAMLAVRTHAQEAVPALIDVCRREQLPVSSLGSAAGAFFSQFRDKLADRLMQSERSYRVTLLGIRHGIDLMRMVSATADAANKLVLEEFCQGWLTTRIVMAERVQDEMTWFVRHPDHATELARPLFLAARRAGTQHN
jgi:hypothetical protein